MKKRWNGVEEAMAYLKRHGASQSDSTIIVDKRVGLHVLGAVDYINDQHGNTKVFFKGAHGNEQK